MKNNIVEPGWFAVEVRTNPEIEDAITNFLFETGSCGCRQIGNRLIGYFKSRASNDEVASQIAAYMQALSQLGFHIPKNAIRIEPIENRDWVSEWKKRFKPVSVSDRFVVKPTWEQFKASMDEIVIDIDPKQAFGTGHHATTSLALEFLEHHVQPGDTVLDLGTGSGILAIAAAKLGAEKVVAIDNDPVAVETAAENIGINRVQSRIRLLTGEVAALRSAKPFFDIAVTNINKQVILSDLTEIVLLVKKSGCLFLTGVLAREQKEVNTKIAKYRDLKIQHTSRKQEWLGLMLSKAALT